MASPAVTAALVSSVTATLVAVANWVRSATRSRMQQRMSDMEVRMEVCERERLRLRRNLELILGALLSLIPEPQRLDLLHRVASEVIDDQEH